MRVGWLVRESRPSAVGQSAGRIDGHHAGPRDPAAPPRGRCRRGGGLPHAARAAADDDRPVAHHLVDGRHRHGVIEGTAVGSWRPLDPRRPGRALSSVELAPGRWRRRRGTAPGAGGGAARRASRGELLLLELLAGEPEPPGLRRGRPPASGASGTPACSAAAGPPAVQSVEGRVAPVDDDRPEDDAHLVLQLVGRLDDLVDRHLLGQGDQGHLASGRIGEQGHHLGGLGADRAAPGGIEQSAGRGQEGHGVTGGRGVHQDQVGDAAALDLLDLPEHQDVPDAGDGPGHQVDDPRGQQPLGHPAHPVVGQVLEQGVVGGDGPGPDRARRDGGGRRSSSSSSTGVGPGRLEHRPGVVEGLVAARRRSATPSRPSSSTTRTDSPAWAARWARAATMVVLPDPALAGHDQDPALATEGADRP